MRIKITLNICLILLVLNVTAQNTPEADFSKIKKGTKALSGRVGFSQSKTEYTSSYFKRTQLELRPGVSYFVKDNLSVGISVPFFTQTYKDTNPLFSNQDYNQTGIGGSVSIRNYKRIAGKFFFTSSLGLSYRWSSNNATNNVLDSKGREGSVAGTAGVLYFLNEKWSLETSPLGIGYSYRKSTLKNDSNSTTTTKDILLNGAISGITLSVRYFIRP
ncbi:MAG: outer membrane beta-barrel protein [Cyclobacteriaceae bacterium]|nr:outer membrane beta-barrel protein [Cyclobacteriaceae bacterium]